MSESPQDPTPDPIAQDQSKYVDTRGTLRYVADGSEVFPGPTGVRGLGSCPACGGNIGYNGHPYAPCGPKFTPTGRARIAAQRAAAADAANTLIRMGAKVRPVYANCDWTFDTGKTHGPEIPAPFMHMTRAGRDEALRQLRAIYTPRRCWESHDRPCYRSDAPRLPMHDPRDDDPRAAPPFFPESL